ncbi:hypothetical protein D9M68_512070 [compost metagenome]
MKNLLFGLSGLFLFPLQSNAWQTTPEVTVAPTVAVTHPARISSVNGTAAAHIQNQDDDPTKSKTFSRSFSVDRNDKVSVANQYGTLTIKTWDKNEVKLDASIYAYATKDEDAQELLDAVSIDAVKSGDQMTFKTNVQQKNNKGWNSWGRGFKNGVKWRREVKIYLTLYMPASNALSASQTYGNIMMDDFSGPTSLKVQYGNLVTGNLSNSNNYISVQYGKANMKQINEANIKLQYGDGLTLAGVNDLTLEAQYTAVNIGTIKSSANIKHQYGKGISIDYAGTLSLTAQYTTIKVNKLGGTFSGNVQYSDLNLENIDAESKIVNIGGDYSDLTLGFGATYGGIFNVATNYGGFKYGSQVTAKQERGQRPGSTSKAYSGQIGKGGAAQVNINTNYGSVTFK